MKTISQSQTEDNFRQSMPDFIKNHFSDVLGEDIHLLSLPNGLDLICDKYLDLSAQAA